MKTKVNIGKLKTCNNVLSKLQFKDVHNKSTTQRNLKSFEILDSYNDELRYFNIELAEVDDKGRVVKDDKGDLIFNRENTIKIEKKVIEQNKKEIEIEIFKFRNNEEISKLPPVILNAIDILLTELPEIKDEVLPEKVVKEEPKEEPKTL